jgi:hypothetical protein
VKTKTSATPTTAALGIVHKEALDEVLGEKKTAKTTHSRRK